MNTDKEMNSTYRRTLGIFKTTGLGESEILLNYRKKIKSDPENLGNINEAALELMKCIVKPRFDFKFSEKIFHGMVDGSISSSKKIVLFLTGFKTLCHKQMFDILKKKYGKQVGSHFERNECEITVDPITLPNDRSGLPCKFPSMKMIVTSSVPYLKFELYGNSGCVFVLFHLKKIIQTFVSKLPEKIEMCYSSPKSSKENSSETDNSETDEDSVKVSSNSSPSPVFRRAKKVNPVKTAIEIEQLEDLDVGETQKNQTKNQEEQIQKAHTKTGTQECTKMEKEPTNEETAKDASNNNTKAAKNQEETRTPIIRKSTGIEKESTWEEIDIDISMSKEDSTEKIELDIFDCADCALIRISESVHKLVEPNFAVNMECSCLCLKVKDAMDNFVAKFVAIICKTEMVNVDSMPQLRENMKIILHLEQKGASGFYCKALNALESVEPLEKDRLVVSLGAILEYCLDEEFGNVLYKDRQARRSLFQYLEATGSYFSFQSVVESFFKMFKHGVDVAKLLPQELKYIVGLFQSGQEMEDLEDFITYHEFISDISRGLICDVYKRGFIDFIKLSKKLFKVDDERLEIFFDNYLYIDKVNSRAFHFLDLGGEVYSEPIHCDNLVYVQEDRIISSRKWDFCLADKSNAGDNMWKVKELNKEAHRKTSGDKTDVCFESGENIGKMNYQI